METKNKDQKSKKKKTLYNIEMLYKEKNSVFEFFDDYSLIVSEAKLKANKGTGLKISIPNKYNKDYG